MTIATVILAAGGSTRMGQPKQLLSFRGRPMVAHAAWTALSAGLGPVVVVVGSDGREVECALRDLPVKVCDNPGWQAGMGSSIRVGVRAIADDSRVGGLVITLADQPLVDCELLLRLADAQVGFAAVACRYGDSIGVPALFARTLFERLRTLPEAHGAKQLLSELGVAIGIVDAPAAVADIDTPEDYRRVNGPDHA